MNILITYSLLSLYIYTYNYKKTENWRKHKKMMITWLFSVVKKKKKWAATDFHICYQKLYIDRADRRKILSTWMTGNGSTNHFHWLACNRLRRTLELNKQKVPGSLMIDVDRVSRNNGRKYQPYAADKDRINGPDTNELISK